MAENMRILLVEDEPAIATAVLSALKREGHAVDHVADGSDALAWAQTYPYSLIILDVILPGLDGLSVCAALRATNNQAPVLILTALDDVGHRVAGLDGGADDYLTKPFAMAELLARSRALLRRPASSRDPVLRIGDLEINPSAHTVVRGRRDVRLTAREFAVLEVLARNPGQLFSRERIIAAVWDADSDLASNIVEVYMRSLRRKLDDPRGTLIETVRGAGYRLGVPASAPGQA
jgi:DNA-binding response OmpR family regulator